MNVKKIIGLRQKSCIGISNTVQDGGRLTFAARTLWNNPKFDYIVAMCKAIHPTSNTAMTMFSLPYYTSSYLKFVKEHLARSVRVFSEADDLVNARQAHAFLEPGSGVRSVTPDKSE